MDMMGFGRSVNRFENLIHTCYIDTELLKSLNDGKAGLVNGFSNLVLIVPGNGFHLFLSF